MKRILLILIFGPWLAGAQDAMSLKDAVRLALKGNNSIEATAASQKAAESRVAEARGGSLPNVNYSESWTRSDNPVFVFSSLLTQHQFGDQNFQIGPLNRPGFLNNFQSQVTADQPIYDAGQSKHAVRSAGLARDLASEDGRFTRMSVIAGVVRAYYDALLASAQLNAANQSVRSAQADLESIRSGFRRATRSSSTWPRFHPIRRVTRNGTASGISRTKFSVISVSPSPQY